MPIYLFFHSQIRNVFSPAVGDRDSDDLRQNSSALFPPNFFETLLRSSDIKAAIGANATYRSCPNAPFNLFTKTGDVCRLFKAYERI